MQKSRPIPYLDRAISPGELVTAAGSVEAPDPYTGVTPEPMSQPLSEAEQLAALEERMRRGE